MAKKEMMGCCMHKGKGVAMIILGLLVLGNVYWPMLSWPAFIGWIIVVGGVLKMLMPHKHYHQ
jgi:uncharacterized membrane protein HdeD (DUF308 family)